MKKVLIVDTIHPVFEEQLSANEFIFTDGTKLSKAEVENVIDDFNGVVIRSRFKLDSDFLAKAKNLQFIARAGAGMENIDVEFAESRGIVCINAPEANRNAVGEHALAMLLALFNKLFIADAEVRNGVWKREENRGIELNGKKIGIIGFGNMGSAFAEVLRGFDMELLAYDKYIKIDKTRFPYVRQVELYDIYINADVISLHVPLTKETTYFVDDTFLNNRKKNIFIINTARGRVLHTEALVDALKSGKVLGACLDVIEYEGTSFEQLVTDQLPSAWQYLTKSDKVVLSPHIAGWSFESHRKISEVMAFKVLELYSRQLKK